MTGNIGFFEVGRRYVIQGPKMENREDFTVTGIAHNQGTTILTIQPTIEPIQNFAGRHPVAINIITDHIILRRADVGGLSGAFPITKFRPDISDFAMVLAHERLHSFRYFDICELGNIMCWKNGTYISDIPLLRFLNVDEAKTGESNCILVPNSSQCQWTLKASIPR